MNAEQITEEYVSVIKKNPKTYYEDYLKTLENVKRSSAVYKGKPVPFLYQPMFYTNEDLNNFKHIGQTLMSITNKIVKRYLTDSTFRKKFGYSELLEKLILADHGYQANVPIGRFDIFYKDLEHFKFCELNTDGSSAMNEDNAISRILLETKPMLELKDRFSIHYFELIEQWVTESITIYNQFNKVVKKPNVAIVDFKGSGTPVEFKQFKKAYEKHGYNAVIADPRELSYDGDNLYYNDLKIDLVYRRIVTRELIERHDEIKDFIQAYIDQSVCVIGPLKSQIMHNKIIFKILHDEDTLQYLSQDEQRYIKNHIPFTQEFKGNKEVFNEVLENKDHYIIKPKDLYASKGVYVGRDFTKDAWKTQLEECFGNEYLYQEFVVPYTRKFVEFKDDANFEVNEFRHIIGLFMYNEKLAGLYTRVGKGNIISGLHSYYTVSNLLVED
ncbi:glutathionylspermidine synthase family protein [Haloplasma contractile]|uniref:Circularly permuted ATP-grasp type 2 protein n=1 Tax=Haloplasma contractile SSD-17B TaxID=1033810 RepID=U2FK66_9MOLU|nr:glutathionylspermidine synthase family protein [Haloplasma contractile]ERJ11624.1 Circularly permuted ATP-grasp type 2 protein [Haloplasma contractile SSD-17B]